MLEDDGRTRKITTKGVAWRARQYVAAWMTGQAGREVRLRHMPHHEHEIEVFDARTGEHLGGAFLADQASPEQIAQVHRARAASRRRLQADLRAAEKTRRVRYAAATAAAPPQPVTAVTAAQAAAELAGSAGTGLRAEARAGLIPPRPGPGGPTALAVVTRAAPVRASPARPSPRCGYRRSPTRPHRHRTEFRPGRPDPVTPGSKTILSVTEDFRTRRSPSLNATPPAEPALNQDHAPAATEPERTPSPPA
jgi:hypothetical protein